MGGNVAVLAELEKAIMSYDAEKAVEASKKSLAQGLTPLTIVEEGLARGIKKVGEAYQRREAFLVDLVMAAETMKAALSVLEPELLKRGERIQRLGRILIGTVEGDIHDIGKSIVVAVLTAGGFEVIDLGVDVPTSTFVQKVKELKPDILGLSALLSTTILKQLEVAEVLEAQGLRNKVKLIIGGAAVTEEWAKQVGADGFAKDALEALEVVKRLLKR